MYSQASLYGLKARNDKQAKVKESSSPTPDQLTYPKGILPSSNPRMYLASRSLSMNASEPSVGTDSERASSAGGARMLQHEASGRRPGSDMNRYAIPSDGK